MADASAVIIEVAFTTPDNGKGRYRFCNWKQRGLKFYTRNSRLYSRAGMVEDQTDMPTLMKQLMKQLRADECRIVSIEQRVLQAEMEEAK